MAELLEQEETEEEGKNGGSDSENGNSNYDGNDSGGEDDDNSNCDEQTVDCTELNDKSKCEEEEEEKCEQKYSSSEVNGEQMLDQDDSKDFVKGEEDEVKMEPESESDEDFDEQNSNSPKSNSFIKSTEKLSYSSTEGEFIRTKESTKPKYVYKGENPPCEICGKKFSRPSDLIKHMVTHTGSKEFKCDICKENFPLLNSLTR